MDLGGTVSGLGDSLQNLNFPASKDDVISNLQDNNAPQEAIDQIRNAGEETFNSADEVTQKVQGNQ
ncbi:MAG: DUF2795 domain-containing protein [Rubrobacteraceae bacterium]|nr:DUF2795 domain-containing protein [Rubrobacter sp.]